MNLYNNVVINFHDVTDVTWFEKVLLFLSKRYNFVSVEEIYEYYYHGRALTRACHITVDDGYKSFYTTIYPLIKKMDIPISLFVSPEVVVRGSNYWFQEILGYDQVILANLLAAKFPDRMQIAGTRSVKDALRSLRLKDIDSVIESYQEQTNTCSKPPLNINVDQLREVHRSGIVAIGAHTLGHPVLANETASSAFNEISGSIQLLTVLLNEPTRWFAYPHGKPGRTFGLRDVEMVRRSGIDLAFSTEMNWLSRSGSPLSIPRCGLSYGNNWFIASKVICGPYWGVTRIPQFWWAKAWFGGHRGQRTEE